jgi:hypothetical protein
MKLAVFCFAAALAALPAAVFAGGRTLWQDGGVQLCGPSADVPVLAVCDSAGGAIAVWSDARNGPANYGIYAQRVDAGGVPLWTENGVLLCDSIVQTGSYLAATADGSGGAIAVWGPPGRSFAVQRVSGDGVPLWGANGLELRPPSESLVEWPALVQDGHGGAIVVWSAICPYTRADTLIACRVDSSGTKQWETAVRKDTIHDQPFLCPDGLGGVIIAWSEGYSGPLRVQRVDSAGDIKWDSAGVFPCTLSAARGPRGCVPVGESCYVVGFWVSTGGIWQARAQMLDGAGNRLWGLTGVSVSGQFYSTSGVVGLSVNGRGLSIWLWSENRTGTDDIFAQKIDSNGTRGWDSLGVWVGSAETVDGYTFSAATDGRGGSIVTWPKHQSGLNWDVYAQHIDSAGHLCWSDTGLAVCRDTFRQEWPPAIVPDAGGGAIVAWLSYQGGDALRIYAQRVADGAGIEEAVNNRRGAMNAGPTVVRGALFLAGEASGHKPQAASLWDINGCRVMELRPGANDLGALAPGVYFVRQEPQTASQKLFVRLVVTR